jgi:hypothetical protein
LRDLREDDLRKFKYDMQRQHNIFIVATKTNEAAVQASSIISQIITKKSKSFTNGECEECVVKAGEYSVLRKNSALKNYQSFRKYGGRTYE